MVENPPASARDSSVIPGLGRSLEKAMATHFNTLAWEVPWTEGPGLLQSMGSQKTQTTTTSISIRYDDKS